MKHIIQTVSCEIQSVLDKVDTNKAEELAEMISTATRIFVSGEGRSGLMGKAFAMRLMHSGYEIYVTGETITPSIEKDDLLIIISGSGATSSLLQYAIKARESGARVALVTTNPQAVIADNSEVIVEIPAATKKRLPNEPETIQPLGNQFDQSVHLLLDAIIIYILERYQQDSHEQMTARHTNLE
ncbi:6-phospho-3-hexuloisomerase [Halobacillus litoralis]|uniref:6-phospho-3-hexuloisomerase n=1 Tax=Halobacillus litoralis TaxID=45668 RepID=A0A410ME86_9BACI|nr:6-phospho-3-hexuloisomerase [Halobacillus litoralis]QAS52975.1 6-phospho-3-hexuloisomerase [Halobacillus litoralis]